MESLRDYAPNIKMLGIGRRNDRCERDVMAIARGLRAGSCPLLEELDLSEVNMFPPKRLCAVEELARAFDGDPSSSSGVDSGGGGGQSTTGITNTSSLSNPSIMMATCNKTLRRLNLYGCHLLPRGIKVLSQAMIRGAFAGVTDLTLSGNNIHDYNPIKDTDFFDCISDDVYDTADEGRRGG